MTAEEALANKRWLDQWLNAKGESEALAAMTSDADSMSVDEDKFLKHFSEASRLSALPP